MKVATRTNAMREVMRFWAAELADVAECDGYNSGNRRLEITAARRAAMHTLAAELRARATGRAGKPHPRSATAPAPAAGREGEGE